MMRLKRRGSPRRSEKDGRDKKDQERDELFRRIYKIATDLVHAGHVAEWDFKSYVLGTMFYRYISENFTAYINEGEHAAGNKDFDYAKIADADAEPAREDLVQEKGFFILPSELFCNVLARADKDDNLNETLERVFNTSKAVQPAVMRKTTLRGCLTILM